ncbi:Lipoyl synthase [Spirochaeta thermophila DSM 6578]|uniref:Lipoyl synthase n=1 Tax=Winmispira thermophila (strain ATCC 700085 / DSM 6578 / Z-1203) TaxID=869211 RepID=G0GDF4_WINT7|nr:lipoyl synthase [Spirochaeta thermophila]AEJ60580.1 Lipoyl synthase [Spirochaeta thermophila DSM 6578]
MEELRKPEWLKIDLGLSPEHKKVRRELARHGLHTVCEEARCPNLHECWGRYRTATFLLLGEVCTRRCRFCAVGHGRPCPPDPEEPARVAQVVARLGIRHVVLTMVTRDDLPDGGAGHVAAAVREVRKASPGVRVEILTSDFRGDLAALETVLESRPEIMSHNVETVRRLTPRVRSGASYERSLAFLREAGLRVREYGGFLKSSFMVGLGETEEEVKETLHDLRAAGVQMVNIGQYLQPTKEHLPVARYWSPEEFDRLRDYALSLGFIACSAGPKVRSSYHAEETVRMLGGGDPA